MAAVEDNGRLCRMLIRHPTSTPGGDWPDTSVAATDDLRNCGSGGRQRLQLRAADHETAEVVELRRLVGEQDAMLERRRRRIATTEEQIARHERRVHDERCARDGLDYVQRAYRIDTGHDNNYNDDDYDDDIIVSREL